jgi:Ser/Thr protein kinase RdoA (MazF antagonist)
MIRVFEELARFHLANPSDGPYTSMYADGAYFDSIKGMLDAELDYHRRFLFEADAFPAFEAAIAPLADDLPCVVHGDVHGWNAIRGGGRAILVDVEWMSRGFALLDFEHLGEGEGEVGLPEGIRRSCIQAYFNARGCDPEEAARLAFARSALDIIRMSTFYKWKGLEREWRSSGDALRRLSARA